MTTLRTLVAGMAVLTLAASALADETAAPPAVIYTKANAPATPKLEDLPLKESVSQYGITWSFDAPTHVGQFVNGQRPALSLTGVDGMPSLSNDDFRVPHQRQQLHARHGVLLEARRPTDRQTRPCR